MQKTLWQVPWGKHRHASVKWNHTANRFGGIDKHHVLPLVIIRDPFSWMQSMCKHRYAARWRHQPSHCPNLVPNEDDKASFAHLQDAFQVVVKYDEQERVFYKSLVHLWSEWYREYFEADYPLLMSK